MLPGFGIIVPSIALTLETVQSLPAMTSNTAPAGHVASASSQESPYNAYRAFDKSNVATNTWATFLGLYANCWVQRQTPSAILVGAYRIVHNNGSGRAPNTFELQGSNDGSSWATLDSRAGQTGWASSGTVETRYFTVPNPTTAYFYHRLSITANNGDTNYTTVNELELLQLL